MSTISRAAMAVALLWTAPAFAQSAQNHEAHHPDAGPAAQAEPVPPAAQSAAPQAGRMGPGMMGNMPSGAMPGNMMGGNMMGLGQMGSGGMMPMMNVMMGTQAGDDHAEGRIAFTKAELKITEAQAPQWNAFAEAVRGNVARIAEMQRSMMSGQGAPSTLPARLTLEDKLLTAHLAALKKTEDALAQLYSVLSEDQKQIADKIVLGPMGMPIGMM